MKLKHTLFLLFSFLFVFQMKAQDRPVIDTTRIDTTKSDKILVDYSDLFEYIQQGDSTLQKLTGEVELRQDSIYMYCDSATIINKVNVIAEGNVIIQQGDSLNVFSDSLAYQSDKRIADLFYNVVLQHDSQKLFTEELNYDLNTKTATYTKGAILTNDTTQLRSKRGYYFVDRDEAFFKDSVTIVNPNFELKADTLAFNTKTQIATFLGPTLINQNGSRIYCEAGFYDARNKVAEFRQNAQFLKEGENKLARGDVIRYDGKKKEITLTGNAVYIEEDREARGNLIRYDEKNDVIFLLGNASYKDNEQFIVSDSIQYDSENETFSTVGRSVISNPPQVLEANNVDFNSELGLGIATGNVIWRDTTAELTIICERADYDRKEDYLKASGGRNNRPLLITQIDGDSLFMTSDTLFAMRDTLAMQLDTVNHDTIRMLVAYNDVRVYKSNLQAVCDSLIYSDADSVFYFFENPIIWADTSQFIADSISIQLANQQIDQIFLKDKAIMINSPDELFFNQIKGKEILVKFDSSEVRTMFVEGNAEAIYYALDEKKAYIGVNQTACSEMLVAFGNNEVETITFYDQPKGGLQPMKKVNHEEIKLEGFQWVINRRPASVDDLFKDVEEELVEEEKSIEGETPVQNFDDRIPKGIIGKKEKK